MKFIDETTIKVHGGNGGNGCVHWRREKYLPKGGPDGGDGGDGGAVVLVAAGGINTLLESALNPILKAQAGSPGGENGKTGARGQDVVRQVPVGTQVFYGDTLVADLAVEGASWIAARGGRGGKGNAFFKSSTNRAPDYAQPGAQGEERALRLELKSVADVGLVGLPNVGKSSLVRALSEAHPLVADYPFTTLRPSLGVVSLDANRRFVIADIPGLIEGAHSGKGLGQQFLRHVERTSVLIYVIDCTQDTQVQSSLTETGECSDELLGAVAEAQLKLLEQELRAFNQELLDRGSLIAFSKGDIELQQRAFDVFVERTRRYAVLLFSSHVGSGLPELKDAVYQLVEQQRSLQLEESV